MTDDIEDKKELIDYRARHQTEREARKIAEKIHLAELSREGSVDTIQLLHNLEPEKLLWNFEDSIRQENLRLQSLLQELNIRQKYSDLEEQTKTNNELKLLMADIARLIAVKRAEKNNTVAIARTERKMEKLKHMHSMVEKEADHENTKDLELFRMTLSLVLKKIGLDISEEEIHAAMDRLKKSGKI
jgi:tRNA U34 5-carboxymethylaminomethyl modifying GTPase MnmE/TrmE